jgi:hypothetical protein
MSKQTAAKNSSKTNERTSIAACALVTLTASDHLAIQAEDRIPERKATIV